MPEKDLRFNEKALAMADIRVALSQLITGFAINKDIPSQTAELLGSAYRFVDMAESIYRIEREP